MNRSLCNLMRQDQSLETKDLPGPLSFFMEPLESRLLLSADFFAAPAVAPVVNHVDVARDLNTVRFDEPNLTINNRGDTGNILITSHAVSAVSTNMFVNANLGNFPVANQGDTWADFDSTGRAWWTNIDNATGGIRVLEVNPTTGQPIGNGVVVNTPPAGQSDDRQALAVDSFPDSPFHDNIYVIWTRFGVGADGEHVFVAVSADHGVTWTTTDIGTDAGFDQQTHIAVDSNGDVWAAYHLQPTFAGAPNVAGTQPDGTTGQIVVFRSTNGGVTWTQTATQPFTAGQADITFNRQEAGNTGTIAGTDFLTQGSVMPYVVPDPVRPNQVYVIAADDTDNNHAAGDQSDLYIARSNDNGATWQRTLLPTGGGTSFQLFPTAVIDQFGTIVVTWYDNRRGLVNDGPDNIAGNADDNFLLDWMGMYSVDGGVNWSAPFQINDVAFDPDEAPLTQFSGGPTTRIGEYFGLDVFGGTAYVAFIGNTPAAGTSQQVMFDAFAISGSLVVSGDDNGPTNDALLIQRLAANPDYVEISVNGERQYVGLFESLSQVTFNGLAGNDSLTIDSSNGLLSFANGIHYDGGTGFNSLTLSGTSAQTSDTYSVGPNPGEGESVITTAGTTQSVFFQNLAPVVDTVVASDLIVNATPADNTINYTDAAGNGLVTVDNFESIEFSNKTRLTINAGVGDDTINLNNPGTPTSLTRIIVNAGDGEDKVTTLAGLPTALTLSGEDGNDLLNASGATGPANLSGGTGNDTLIGGSSSDSISGASGEDLIDGRGGLNTLDGGADVDTILVSGTAGADTITTTHGGTFDITGGLSAGTNTISDIEAVRVEAGAGADNITLNLSAAGGLNYTVLGGNPIGAPGDVLQVNSGATMTVTPGPENDAGSVDAATTTPTNVSYDEIELLIISGGGGAVVNGTNGPDTFTVIARDASTHAGADGVQDFTVALNTLPEVLFLNQPSLTIRALGGSDQVTLRTPAPNNAVWAVDVTVDGGLPPADSDRLIVETPKTDPLAPNAETVVYTPDPTQFDGGTLDLASLSSPITMSGIETLIYDGRGDNDSLTIVGTDGDDTIVHNPASTDPAGGSLQVNSLLALNYQNLGSGAVLKADGAGGTDTLVYNGTATNDTFIIDGAGSVGGDGQVNLVTRLGLNTTSVEALTLEGLSGDDTFTLVPAISDSVYSTINLNGGGQASAAGDRVNLVGTALDDNIIVDGPAIKLGGKTINTSGIESIGLNALGNGGDRITYNGVSGVTEDIRVNGSGIAGSGQISVPGVTLINFSNVELIKVNGNAPTPTETDTLTFAGTNAVDTFNINLAAAGTSTDPVLKLQNGSLLLTLENYTNFNTLRVLGLDGADTFNVTTKADPSSGRNLFVDGGQPTGKKKSTDNLNVIYTPPRPSIIHSTETQNPDAGIVDLDYGTARFVVQYDDIEQVTIRRN